MVVGDVDYIEVVIGLVLLVVFWVVVVGVGGVVYWF